MMSTEEVKSKDTTLPEESVVTKIPKNLNTIKSTQKTPLANEIPEVREPVKVRKIPPEPIEGKMRINEIPTKGKVIIRMIVKNKKNSVLPNIKRRLGAFMDSHGRIITGVYQDEWEAWSKLLDLKIDKEFWRDFFFTLTSAGRELDLSVEIHRLYYAFIRRHYEIANTNTSKDINHKTTFYIMDEVAEANVADKKFDLVLEAMNILSKMTESQRADFSLLFGLKPYNVDPTVLKNRMAEKLNDKPSHFLRLFRSPDRANEILLKKLAVKNILQESKGAYYDGTEIIGADKDRTVAFLKDPENNAKVIAYRERLQMVIENAM